MSSSNRVAVPCDGTVERADRPVGPLRLPMKNRVDFIAEFNRKYNSAGLSIHAIKQVEPNLPVPIQPDQVKPVNGPSPQ